MNSRLEKLKGFESFADESERKDSLRFLEKIADADQHGAFQHFQSNVTEYATRERYLSQRGGEPPERTTEGLYNLSPDHGDSYVPEPSVATHLSTRYSPDRVGVQALRVSDGVFQDPYTNKIYDYNEGFKAEDGRTFPPGSAALQSSMMHMANHLDQKGLVKEANYLDALIKESASARGAAAAAGAGAVYNAGGLLAAGFGTAAALPVAAGAAAGIFAYLIGTEVLTPAAKAVWDRLPENTKAALQQVAAAVKAVPAGMAEDLKAGLRAALEKALALLGPEQQTQASAESTNSVIKLANYLDENGFVKEANYLDSLIKKTAGGYVSVGGSNPDDALSTEEIGKLYDLGWRRDDFADVDRSTPSVREALGLDSSGASVRENRPLTTAELASLFEAHEDPSSDYKLTSDRLRDVNNSNLTDEEVVILDAAGPLVGTASKLVNSLIAFSTHLDENGLNKEADYLDSLIKKTKE
jgi:hypothetical protein